MFRLQVLVVKQAAQPQQFVRQQKPRNLWYDYAGKVGLTEPLPLRIVCFLIVDVTRATGAGYGQEKPM